MKSKRLHNLLLLFCCIVFVSCVEEIDTVQVTNFDSLLVIEATITDELKHQEIILSRSYELDVDGPVHENGAIVRVIGNDGSTYNFNQSSDGYYLSAIEFSAQPNVSYIIEVTTSNGSQYTSGTSQLASESLIDNLYVERDFNENGEEGVSIYIDAANPNSVQQLFRYQYEETYKIIAPQYSPFELVIQNDDFPYPPEVFQGLTPQELVDFFVTKEIREPQDQVQICYNTVNSNEIFIVDSAEFETNVLEKHRIRFISRLNYIMQHRYSILVRQYTQSPEAHEFYKTLKSFSESESIFSQVQPGFLQGNIIPVTEENENVAGFFEVSSVDERRVYFNYADLFPGEELPPYYKPCFALQIPPLYQADPLTGEITNSPLQTEVFEGHTFYLDNFIDDISESFIEPYQLTVSPSCGDCTVLGNNVPPDFWEE